MHCEFPGLMGTAVQAISRFCVPFFFMVSGYFCFKPFWREAYAGSNTASVPAMNIGKKVLHVAKITFWASVFYLVFVVIQQLLFHDQNFSITSGQLFNWVALNSPRIIAGQYWFLFALLYAYLLYWLLLRLRMQRYAYALAAVLFVVYYLLAQGLHLYGISVPNHIYRNWLIEAFPYFMLGHWIHEYQDRIKLSNRTLLIIIAASTLLSLPERWLLGRDFSVNFCTLPQVFALFIYGVKNPDRHSSILQRLGRDCSMLVYIIHPAVWHSVDRYYAYAGFDTMLALMYLRPIIVLALTIMLALLFNWIVAHFEKPKALKA